MSTKTRGKIARSEKSRDFPRGTSSICRKIVHCRRLNRARRVLERCRAENSRKTQRTKIKTGNRRVPFKEDQSINLGRSGLGVLFTAERLNSTKISLLKNGS
jgi:hypothetical protein